MALNRNASNTAGDMGDAFGPGYPLKSPVAGAPSDNRSYPYRLRSQARSALRLAGMAVRTEIRFGRRAGRNRRWGPCRWREIRHPAVTSHCVTRARASNPPGPPLRSGLAQEALGRTVKVADREDRGAIFRTRFGNFPHHLRPRPSRARCSPCARVPQQDITTGIGPGPATRCRSTP